MSNAEYKPDCGYAWMIVVACFTINFIMTGLVRASGVLYVALIDVYGVSRQVATMPFSLRFCLRNMSGPLVGALGQRFGIRPVVLLGGFMCGLGGILSAIAPSITWIIVAWGGIHGIGYGFCNIIHVITINRYFQKYRGLALGICYTGDCFGTFLLPLLLDFLLETFDLKGTFLILAGVSLNAVPAAMLLKSPPWNDVNSNSCNVQDKANFKTSNNVKKEGTINEGFDVTFEECLTSETKLPHNPIPDITITEQIYRKVLDGNQCLATDNELTISGEQPCMQYFDFHSNAINKNHRLSDTIILNEIYSLRESTSLRVTDKNMKKKRRSCHVNAYDMNRKNSELSVISCPSHLGKCTAESSCKNQFLHPYSAYLLSLKGKGDLSNQNRCEQRSRNNSIVIEKCSMNIESNFCSGQSQTKQAFKQIPLYEKEVLAEFERDNKDIFTKTEKIQSSTLGARKESSFLQFLRTNIKPMFLLTSVTMAVYVFLFISVFTIIIDYASDNNIPNEFGKYLIIAFSVTDVFGRLGFGVVLDKKWISVSYYAGLTTGIMGFSILIIPLFKNFIFWIISFSLCGFVQGGAAIMFPVLVERYMEKHEESVALGCLNFYGGLLMLPIPSMIGYFRDNTGSYDGVFWTTGALCVLAGSFWIFEPCIVRKKEDKLYQTAYCSEDGKISSNT